MTGLGILLIISATQRICGGETGEEAWTGPTLSCPALPWVFAMLGHPKPIELAPWFEHAEMIGVGLIVLLLIVASVLLWRIMRPELGTED